MSEISVQVERLGKQYHRAAVKQRRDTLRDIIVDSFVAPFRRARKLLRGQATGAAEMDEKFWAIRDISFEVKRGEVVGIIGRNGAGKSTLLKVLSRITQPEEGYADLRGRLGSLLEVGTGFHPELTGRENVFLNGAILGMRRTEIDRKFDEIIAFSGVEKFIDTPVKHYSSGMTVRLAFAVAAHLDPEILIIDEVLAVGDAAFQRKCLDKMRNVTRQGRTVLFVSHNMSAVDQLRDRAVFLADGMLHSHGPTDRIIAEYLNYGAESSIGVDGELSGMERVGNEVPIIARGMVNGEAMLDHMLVRPFEPLTLTIEVDLPETVSGFALAIYFVAHSECVFGVSTAWDHGTQELPRGRHRLECRIPELALVPGAYNLSIGVASDGQRIDWLEQVACVEVSRVDVYGTKRMPGKGEGFFLPRAEWTLDRETSGVS